MFLFFNSARGNSMHTFHLLYFCFARRRVAPYICSASTPWRWRWPQSRLCAWPALPCTLPGIAAELLHVEDWSSSSSGGTRA